MTVFPIPAFIDNYIWAIVDHDAGMFDCVDPGEAEPVIEFAKSKQLTLRSILLTHHHNDHMAAYVNYLILSLIVLFTAQKTHEFRMLQIRCKRQQLIHVGSCSFHVLFNPGHTSTHISYYEPRHNWLFCGDTLFSAGCGRVFDGTMEELHQSMLLFKKLPKTTKIYCAHEYTMQNLKFAQSVEPQNVKITEQIQKLNQQSILCSLPSTLSLELDINPFLRTENTDVIHYAINHGAASSSSFDVFRTLRNEKNNFS